MNHLNDQEVKDLLFGFIAQFEVDKDVQMGKNIDQFISYLKDQEIYLNRSTDITGFEYSNTLLLM